MDSKRKFWVVLLVPGQPVWLSARSVTWAEALKYQQGSPKKYEDRLWLCTLSPSVGLVPGMYFQQQGVFPVGGWYRIRDEDKAWFNASINFQVRVGEWIWERENET